MTVVDDILRSRPAVHQICAGAFVQERLHLGNALWVIPLQPLGFASEAQVAALYAIEALGAPVDQPAVDGLIAQGRNARPMVAIIRHAAVDSRPENLEMAAHSDMARARLVMAWSTGEVPVPIAIVTATSTDTFFRLLPPDSRRRQRLGFGNERERHEPVLKRVFDASANDARFAFAVSMYVDALKAEDPESRVARFYACLEALTYRIRHRHGSKSRAAVRDLIGLPDGATMMVADGPEQLTIDRVELGGRIRDKLFHGVPFDDSELKPEARRAYAILKSRPSQLGDVLMTDCELEIARWANGASRGLANDGPDSLN